jgi:hypothetical protein
MLLAVISSAHPMRRSDYDWITSTTSSAEIYDGTTTYALDTGCDGPCGTVGQAAASGCKTCAASFCTTIKTEPSCTWATQSDQTSDYAASIAAYTCQTCTQSTTDERCSATWLNANLLTTHSGLKGAYCTDKWLVVFSDGSPGFLGGTDAINLGNIPAPPGGTDQDGVTSCRTRTWWTGLEVWKVPLRTYYQLLSTSTPPTRSTTAHAHMPCLAAGIQQRSTTTPQQLFTPTPACMADAPIPLLSTMIRTPLPTTAHAYRASWAATFVGRHRISPSISTRTRQSIYPARAPSCIKGAAIRRLSTSIAGLRRMRHASHSSLGAQTQWL